MIAGFFTAAWVLVDPAARAFVCKRRRDPDVIDAQTVVTLPRAFAVVPPRKFLQVAIHLAKNIDETPLFDVMDRGTLGFGKSNWVKISAGLRRSM